MSTCAIVLPVYILDIILQLCMYSNVSQELLTDVSLPYPMCTGRVMSPHLIYVHCTHAIQLLLQRHSIIISWPHRVEDTSAINTVYWAIILQCTYGTQVTKRCYFNEFIFTVMYNMVCLAWLSDLWLSNPVWCCGRLACLLADSCWVKPLSIEWGQHSYIYKWVKKRK